MTNQKGPNMDKKSEGSFTPGPDERYEKPSLTCGCYIARTYPDAHTQWEMGGRAAIHHIKLCPLHNAAHDLLDAAQDVFDSSLLCDRGFISSVEFSSTITRLGEAISKATGSAKP